MPTITGCSTAVALCGSTLSLSTAQTRLHTQLQTGFSSGFSPRHLIVPFNEALHSVAPRYLVLYHVLHLIHPDVLSVPCRNGVTGLVETIMGGVVNVIGYAFY